MNTPSRGVHEASEKDSLTLLKNSPLLLPIPKMMPIAGFPDVDESIRLQTVPWHTLFEDVVGVDATGALVMVALPVVGIAVAVEDAAIEGGGTTNPLV